MAWSDNSCLLLFFLVGPQVRCRCCRRRPRCRRRRLCRLRFCRRCCRLRRRRRRCRRRRRGRRHRCRMCGGRVWRVVSRFWSSFDGLVAAQVVFIVGGCLFPRCIVSWCPKSKGILNRGVPNAEKEETGEKTKTRKGHTWTAYHQLLYLYPFWLKCYSTLEPPHTP